MGGVYNCETGRKITAVMPVHVFGNPASAETKKIARAWGISLIEDAAEAIGSWHEDTHCGLVGDIGILSFNGNKLILVAVVHYRQTMSYLPEELDTCQQQQKYRTLGI